MRVLMTIVVLVSCTWAGQDTSPDTEATNGSCGIREVYKFDGWQIPGLAGAMPEGELLADKDVPGVSIRQMRSGKTNELLVIIGCARKSIGRVDYKSQPVSVMRMWRYEFSGKVFAYSVVYSIWGMSKGKRVPLPAYVAVGFYDTDGSGRFRIMRYEEAERMLRNVEVPEWVRRATQFRVP